MSDAVTNGVAVAVSASQDRMSAVLQYIEHHSKDSNQWSPLPHVTINLPGGSFVLPWGQTFNWQVTLHGMMMVAAAIILVLVFSFVYRRSAKVPSGWTNMLEFFVQFIRDQVAVPNLGEEDGRKFTPLLCSFFFFILTMNLMGLIPGFPYATSNLSVTAALGCISFAVMVFGAMYRHGVVGFLKGLVPSGIPWPVILLMFPIEVAGLFIKSMALMIRLFANMLAGHIIVFSLLGLMIAFGALASPAIIMALGIYLLDVFVSFFQAFIFTLLSAVFIGQRYHPAH